MRNPSPPSPPAPSSSKTKPKTTTTTTRSATTGKTTPCCSKVGLKRGPWTPEEDELLSTFIKREGEGRWRTLPKRAGLLRCGKSCRLRWMNYLRPSVKRGQIAPDEEDLILRLHRLLGNRWSLIAGRIPGRTDNEIKNYWNTHLSKKLISQGIDPRTHKPLNPQDQHQQSANNNKPSSSKTNQGKPSSSPTSSKPTANNNDLNSNTNPASSGTGLDDTTSGSSTQNQVIITNNSNQEEGNHNNGYFESTSQLPIAHGYMSLLNCDGTASGGMELMMMRRSNNLSVNYHQKLIVGSNDEDEDINNYCTDDVFSSFLNSLINEEAFVGQQQQQPNGITTVPASDPLVASTFGLGNGWESAVMSSSNFTQNDHNKRVAE